MGLMWIMQVEADGNEPLAAGVAEFTAAYEQWDGARFAAAAEQFARLPESAASRYWQWRSEFHRLSVLLAEPAGGRRRPELAVALANALQALQRACGASRNRRGGWQRTIRVCCTWPG